MSTIPQDKLELGRAILAGGAVTQDLLQRELDASGKAGGVLGKALLQAGLPTEAELFALLTRTRIPKVNARKTSIPLEIIRLVPEDVARRGKVLALDQIGKVLVVVTPDLAQPDAFSAIRQATGLFVTPIQCLAEGFDEVVAEYYQRLADSGLAPVSTAPAGGDAPAATGGVAALQAIPEGAPDEDEFFRRFMSGGPVPADEVLM